MKISLQTTKPVQWFLDLSVADSISLPFKNIGTNRVECEFENMKYALVASKGSFSKLADKGVMRMAPDNNTIILDLATGNITK